MRELASRDVQRIIEDRGPSRVHYMPRPSILDHIDPSGLTRGGTLYEVLIARISRGTYIAERRAARGLETPVSTPVQEATRDASHSER